MLPPLLRNAASAGCSTSPPLRRRRLFGRRGDASAGRPRAGDQLHGNGPALGLHFAAADPQHETGGGGGLREDVRRSELGGMWHAAGSPVLSGLPGSGTLPSGVLARGGWARRAAPSWPCKLQKGPVTRCPPPKQSLAATWPWRGPAAHRWRHRKRSSQGPRRRAARGNGEGGREWREGVSIHAKFDVHRTQAPREAAPRRVEAVPEFSRIFSELLKAPRPLHRGGEAGTQKSERSPPAAHTRITDRPTRRLRPPRSGS